MSEKASYPLYWPDGRQRAAQRRTNSHFKASFAAARDNVVREIRRLGGTGLVISTNVRLLRNGLPEAVEFGKLIKDPGVAVYFTRKGRELCFACDCWNHIQDNMHAISLTIEALRGIARWGTGDMMEAAFRGFAALPPPTEGSSSWWQILGVPMNATLDQAREAYVILVKKHHPDVLGGDAELFRRVQWAWEQVEKVFR